MNRLAQFLLLGLLALASCGAPTSYAGIPLKAGADDSAIQAVAYRAMRGDPYARLQLGILFEEGRNVPQDWRRAIELYRLAAGDAGTVRYRYVSVAGKERGQVQPVFGTDASGLAEARMRLEALERKTKQ